MGGINSVCQEIVDMNPSQPVSSKGQLLVNVLKHVGDFDPNGLLRALRHVRYS